MPGRALVTGAGGFAGRHLVRHLTDQVCQALGDSVSKSGRPFDRPVLAQVPDDPHFLKPVGREN